MHTDVAVIGGGIVGLATARALTHGPDAPTVALFEKEPALARHQSAHNSGVLHAGLAYRPGSAKARLARDGIRRMTDYCRHHGVAHDICGKLVVATTESEIPRLDATLERGRKNGLEGLRRIGPEEAREIEPHVRCVGALQVPEEGIADFPGVCAALAGEIEAAGYAVHTGATVVDLVREGPRWRVVTAAGDFSTRVIVNCAGLYADRIARMAGEDPGMRILPFRGEYLRLRPEAEHLVRHMVYPVGHPAFPFLGVHFTRRVGGGVDAGPGAVLAFAREGYRLGTVDLGDLAEALSYPGLWRFALRHPGMVARELAQSFHRPRFVAALQRLIPGIVDSDLGDAHAGVRAQAVLPSGDFVHDFAWIERPGAVHVLNAPSPAATASLAIGAEIAGKTRTALEMA